MKKIVLSLFLIFSFVANAQLTGEDEVYLSGDKTEPKFMGGGIDKFYGYVSNKFDFSVCNKEGKMISSFTIDEEGNIKNIKIIQFVDVESATEMIRVLKTSPKWQPANKEGKPISVEIKMPFDIVLKDKLKEEIISSAPKVSNTQKNPTDEVDCKNFFSTACVEVKPEYPGGIKEFYKYISEKYKAPNVKGLSGKLLIGFTVEKDGSLADIKVLKDIGYGTGEEAIRVLKKCKKWTPAYQDGKEVRCTYMLPITIMTP